MGLDGSAADLWRTRLASVTTGDVEKTLAHQPGTYNPPRLLTLISPAAQNYLEEMARIARELTIRRFGKTIQLYAPLYLSNYCINSCLYCGYNRTSRTTRTRLTIEQALTNASVLAAEGFRHILLVSGEDPKYITIDYLTDLAARLRDKFSSLSIEVYPMTTEQYAALFRAGIDGVTVYQETYNRAAYAHYHPAGPKSDYDSRLLTCDRAGAAGMRRLGVAALLGLEDFRLETLALAEHAHYLMKRYWKARVSFSFPRLRPAPDTHIKYDHLLTDRNLVQMMLALRLCFADAEIVISTRERPDLRDNLVNLGVTRMSAGSKTSPGGYTNPAGALQQFEIDDKRPPAQVAEMIRRKGYEPVWKDWDAAFTQT